MLRTFTRSQALSSNVRTAIKTGPRYSSAFLHTQFDENENKDATIHALGGRLGLQDLNVSVLKQAVTHKSVKEGNNNSSLEFIGKRVTALFATEYVHSKYPSLHPEAFEKTLGAIVGNASFSKIGSEVGLQHSIKWTAPEDNTNKLGQFRVLADCMNAIVGAVYQEKGQEAAKKFVHDFVLSRDIDVRPAVKVDEPKRHLTALLKQLNQEPAVSKLLSETGRLSSAPVFIVGVFSGENKIGEGFGSSLKMAEHRACQDALINHYAKEQKDFVLPSDAANVDKYVAAPLGINQAIV